MFDRLGNQIVSGDRRDYDRAGMPWLDRTNPFHYIKMAEGDCSPIDQADVDTARKAAKKLLPILTKALPWIAARVQQLTRLYDQRDVFGLHRWLRDRPEVPAIGEIPDTLKRRQAEKLLAKYEGYFTYWGWNLPRSKPDGFHLYSNDIAQEARLAFFKAFTPHCEIGFEGCKSEVKTSLAPLKTPTGRVRRKVQSSYRDGKKFATGLRPVFRIKSEYSPSCQKNAHVALKAAHYAAITAADRFARQHREKTVTFDASGDIIAVNTDYIPREVPFSSLAIPEGITLSDYLDRVGENPVTFANEVGINSQWADVTLSALEKETSKGNVREYIAAIDLENGKPNKRLGKALRLAAEKGMLAIFLESAAGFSLPEIADNTGVPVETLKKQVTRFKNNLDKRAIA